MRELWVKLEIANARRRAGRKGEEGVNLGKALWRRKREREKRNYVCAEIMVELDDTSMSISSSSFLLLLFFPFLSLSRPSKREKEGQ